MDGTGCDTGDGATEEGDVKEGGDGRLAGVTLDGAAKAEEIDSGFTFIDSTGEKSVIPSQSVA